MTKRIYELKKRSGKYHAYPLDYTYGVKKYGIITDYGVNSYFDGSFEADIYHGGKLTDIKLKGWFFSPHFKGDYHEPGTFYNTSFEIECFDPNDKKLKLYSTPHKIRFSEEDVLCHYLEMITIYSKFENADIALRFNYLSRSIDEGLYGGRFRVPMKMKYEDILSTINFFKKYYEKLVEGKDDILMTKIKEAVNCALESLKNRLDFDKID